MSFSINTTLAGKASKAWALGNRQRLTQINPGLETLKGIIFCFQPGNLKYEKHAAEKHSNIVQC